MGARRVKIFHTFHPKTHLGDKRKKKKKRIDGVERVDLWVEIRPISNPFITLKLSPAQPARV